MKALYFHRRSWIVSGLLLLLIPLNASLVCAASPAEDLFQKALVKESVERDLDAAIRIYQRTIDAAQGEPATAAEARLRMGICFEKLGKPPYAEDVYKRILDEPTGVPSDIAQQARTNLRRLETEKRLVQSSSGTLGGVWTPLFLPTRFSFLLGPSLVLSDRGAPVHGLSLGLRYRMSRAERTAAWYLEANGLLPVGHSRIANLSESFGTQGTDHATLNLNYQASIGLMGELPHGSQRTWIPEIGTGLAVTGSRLSYTTTSSVGAISHQTNSPYLEAGIHVFPDRVISAHLRSRFVTTPYPRSIDISSPSHTQTFGVPSSQWLVSAIIQLKIGHREFVLKPKS